MAIYPNSETIERNVIVSFINDPSALRDNIHLLNKEDFWNHKYRGLFEAIVDLNNDNIYIDIYSLTEYFKKNGVLINFGGEGIIRTICNEFASSANIGYNIQELKEYTKKRKIMYFARETVLECKKNELSSADILGELSNKIMEIDYKCADTEEILTSDYTFEVIEKLKKLNSGEKQERGLSTGIYDLDYTIGGMQPGQLIVLAAKTEFGKSSFAMNIAQEVARKGHAVYMFSLEMKYEELIKRQIQSEARVDLKKAYIEAISHSDWYDIIKAAERINDQRIYINDRAGVSIEQVKSTLTRAKSKYDIKLAVVDYLQLVEGRAKTGASREQEVASISRGLKMIAMNLGIPIIAISQFSRKVEDREGMPHLADLRESGAIEQDANAVLFIYNRHTDEKTYNYSFCKTEEDSLKIRELYVGKNREGASHVTIFLRYTKEWTRFEALEAI